LRIDQYSTVKKISSGRGGKHSWQAAADSRLLQEPEGEGLPAYALPGAETLRFQKIAYRNREQGFAVIFTGSLRQRNTLGQLNGYGLDADGGMVAQAR
jgi:hypothetical protein